MNTSFKVAILDLYNGEANQGMRCIIDIVNRFNHLLNFQVFDIRAKQEFPNFEDFDIYISSGGPGSPYDGDGNYYQLIDNIWNWNKENEQKKHILFICHSFQMACIHFGLAEITKRKSTSLGVMTIHKVESGINDWVLNGLSNPFYAVDSRDYQVIQPKKSLLKKKGFEIIALEKIRNHVEYERAIMGIRFSQELVGFQFHPEADPVSFIENLKDKNKREKIIELKGKSKFRDMLEDLIDEEKIYKTNNTLIPNFLRNAVNKLMQEKRVFNN